jgi:hypothetical protein
VGRVIFLDAQQILHGLELGGTHGADFFGGGEFIELRELDAEAADADAELMAETAERIDERLVIQTFGDDNLALQRPAGWR